MPLKRKKKLPSNRRILHILLENIKYFIWENFNKLHQILSVTFSLSLSLSLFYSPLSSSVMFCTIYFQTPSYTVNYDKIEGMRLVRELIRKLYNVIYSVYKQIYISTAILCTQITLRQHVARQCNQCNVTCKWSHELEQEIHFVTQLIDLYVNI